MPISSIASYLSTTQEFITHWTAVNADLGPGGPLVLPVGYNVASLTTDRTNLQTKITAIETADNAVQIAAGSRDIKKGPLRERLRQFRTTVQSLLKGSDFIYALPNIPKYNLGEGPFMKALDDASNLWTRINAAAPPPPGVTLPLTLVGGYTLASFNTEVAAIRAAYGTWNDAVQGALIARQQRNVLLPPLKARLIQYRLAVQGRYAAGSPLILSLPAVSPPPGSTPDPVVLSGVWNPTSQEADLSWTPSAHPTLKHYVVRACDPPRYRAADEVAVATILPPATTFSTAFGLGLSGAVKFFKVYVVTDDDNEKGSNSVKIIRP